MTDPIRAKIIEACLELKDASIYDSQIWLHHVLRAIAKTYNMPFKVSSVGDISCNDIDAKLRWNLSLDYDNQEQPVKDLIGTLIGVV